MRANRFTVDGMVKIPARLLLIMTSTRMTTPDWTEQEQRIAAKAEKLRDEGKLKANKLIDEVFN